MVIHIHVITMIFLKPARPVGIIIIALVLALFVRIHNELVLGRFRAGDGLAVDTDECTGFDDLPDTAHMTHVAGADHAG